MKPGGFSRDRCDVTSQPVVPGNWVAYFTMVGGQGRGRWLRALVFCVQQHPRDAVYRGRPAWPNGAEVHALDEEDDVVYLTRWEKVSTPPPLKPAVLRSWLRMMTYYVPAHGELAV